MPWSPVRRRGRWGRCSAAPGAPAFWPWTQVLGGVPTLDTAMPRSAGSPSASGLGNRLGSLAGRAGVAVVLDDAHWADPDSLVVLEIALEHAASPLLLVLTARDDPPRAPDELRQVLASLARGHLDLRLAGRHPPVASLLVRRRTSSGWSPAPAATRTSCVDGRARQRRRPARRRARHGPPAGGRAARRRRRPPGRAQPGRPRPAHRRRGGGRRPVTGGDRACPGRAAAGRAGRRSAPGRLRVGRHRPGRRWPRTSDRPPASRCTPGRRVRLLRRLVRGHLLRRLVRDHRWYRLAGGQVRRRRCVRAARRRPRRAGRRGPGGGRDVGAARPAGGDRRAGCAPTCTEVAGVAERRAGRFEASEAAQGGHRPPAGAGSPRRPWSRPRAASAGTGRSSAC